MGLDRKVLPSSVRQGEESMASKRNNNHVGIPEGDFFGRRKTETECVHKMPVYKGWATRANVRPGS